MCWVDRFNAAIKPEQRVENERNQQLASMIGRRLREACGGVMVNELPAAIANKLAALREAEASRAAVNGASSVDKTAPAGCKAALDQASLDVPFDR